MLYELHINAIHMYIYGFPGGSDGKEFTCNAGDPGLIPGSGIYIYIYIYVNHTTQKKNLKNGKKENRQLSRRMEWQPTSVFLPGEFHGQRNLARYSPWGHSQT